MTGIRRSGLVAVDQPPAPEGLRGGPSSRPELPAKLAARLQIIEQKQNIVVNPAWNLGVFLARAELIGILNDDILVQPALFPDILALDWDAQDIGIIGLRHTEAMQTTQLTPVSIDRSRPMGMQLPVFGSCMFVRRRTDHLIPETLRVWFGDDDLAHHCGPVHVLDTPLVTGSMSTMIRSLDPESEVHAVIQQDVAWAHRHLLENAVPPEMDRRPDGNGGITASPSKGRLSLDLGCGEMPRNLYDADRAIGIDAHCSQSGILNCWVGFELIPLEASSVDVVTADDFLEHLPRYALREKPFNPFIEAMNEIWRVLRHDGLFFARTPAYPLPAAFQDPTHVNIITDQAISSFAGRPCVDGTVIDSWGPELGRRYGFVGDFVLKQDWDATHLCWELKAIKA